MLRIRPGRAWKHNPSYLGELRTLTAPAARAFTGAGLSDALGIEVDGVDIAAGAGEAPIVPAVEELCEALLRIGAGTPAAQATVGVGPTELLLEPRGPEVKLTLVALRRPGRVLVTDVLVDTLRLRKAARAAAHGLLLDLLEVCPALEGAPLARRLLRLCANLTKRPSRAAPAWPKVAEGQRASALSVRAGKPSLRGEVRLSPDACARLTGTSLVPQAPLLPLLGAGTVSLKLPAGPSLQIEGAPFLILRDLLAEGHDLLRALERHEPMQVLRFGKSELSFDPTRAALRVTGLTEAIELKPETLVGALGAMTMRYCAQALKLAGAHAQVTELRETAKELVELARALGSGELQRSNETVRSPPAKKERRAAPKRARGQLRRVLYRQTVQARVGPLLPGGLQLAPEPQGEGGRVIVSGPMGVVALDLITGEPRWSFGEGRGPWMLSRVPGGEDLLAAGGELLTRLDPQTGTARWKRRLSSPV
ncbi:MAG: hypothetical protein JST92_13500 [Deltaproteobacteria bacterium]|nr:hypothetical protein [Deltaproteobacteria bacterium]